MNILEANNIVKDYTGHRALDNVSIAVPQGKVYGLLGPNGAGKTTLIRIINHITAPDSGEVIFDGHRLTQDDVTQIGYLPEERGLYKKMRVGDQALFFAQLKGLNRNEAERALREWFDRFDISSWWGKKVEELSKGMAQKVQFIVTVLHRPKLLIFDEPFSGFDPINAQLLKNEILRLRDEGATVIFSTHNMPSVEELCDHITLINNSHNILTGDVEELRSRYGRDKYVLSYQGDPNALAQALATSCREIQMLDQDKNQRHTMEISLIDSDARRNAIAEANKAVELFSFQPKLMSMSDIFIKAVAESNETLPPEFNPQMITSNEI
ncbi:MAG: ATP-binding cassette domain-containing protein [Bacteroidales bacterium]|nr:ATP-binding cassette domain-containing protein [Bacteroidales bacterium]